MQRQQSKVVKAYLPAQAGWAVGVLCLVLFAVSGAHAAGRQGGGVRVSGGQYAEDGHYIYELRCRDGSRRKAVEHWSIETTPPKVLKTCAYEGSEAACRDGADVYTASEWICSGS